MIHDIEPKPKYGYDTGPINPLIRDIVIERKILQNEVIRLRGQRDRLRGCIVRMDDIQQYAGQRGTKFREEIENDPYYNLQPGDMTSD